MITRRSLLRSAPAAPLAVHAVAQEAKMRLAGAGITSGMSGNIGVEAPSVAEPMKFFDFATWLRKIGHHRIRREAYHVSCIDPDLVEMRSVSLAAKFRIQRERNYRRLLAEQKDWFERQMSIKGLVEQWA